MLYGLTAHEGKCMSLLVANIATNQGLRHSKVAHYYKNCTAQFCKNCGLAIFQSNLLSFLNRHLDLKWVFPRVFPDFHWSGPISFLSIFHCSPTEVSSSDRAYHSTPMLQRPRYPCGCRACLWRYSSHPLHTQDKVGSLWLGHFEAIPSNTFYIIVTTANVCMICTTKECSVPKVGPLIPEVATLLNRFSKIWLEVLKLLP